MRIGVHRNVLTARPIRSLVLAASLASAVAMLAVSQIPARADSTAGVSVAIKPSSAHPASHKPVRLTVTVTNRGPASRSDFTVSLTTRGGLSKVRVTSAPPDSISVSCAPTPPGAPPDCSSRAVPPVCHSARDTLSCHYSSLAFAAAGSAGDSLALELSARTGARGTETARASAAFAKPGPASASASVKLRVGGSSAKKHRSGTSGGKGATNGYGKKYKPVLGKWTGTNSQGLQASFVVSAQPSYRTKYDLPPYGYEDLTFDRPLDCPPSPSTSASETEATSAATPFPRNGSFGLKSSGILGGLTGARAAQLKITYTIPANPAIGPGCSGTIVWHLEPVG